MYVLVVFSCNIFGVSGDPNGSMVSALKYDANVLHSIHSSGELTSV